MNYVRQQNSNNATSKFETNQNNKFVKNSYPYSNQRNNKPKNLELRTFEFANDCRKFLSQTTKSIFILEDAKQLIRSSGSIGANYLEANEKLSKKDLILRLKISKKEAKESRYWLQLIKESMPQNDECNRLIDECTQLMNILGAIIIKCQTHSDRTPEESSSSSRA